MAERKGSAFRSVLSSAELLSEAAILRGLFQVKRPFFKSST